MKRLLLLLLVAIAFPVCAQVINPPPVRLPIGCTSPDATCVPHRTGEQPFDINFSPPHAFTEADCGGAGVYNMPGVSYTYPGAGTQQLVWCPQTFAQLQSLLNFGVFGGKSLSPGDMVMLAPRSVQTYTNSAGVYVGSSSNPCITYPMTHYMSAGYASSCDIRIPPLVNPSHKVTYVMSRGIALLPAAGNRIHPATDGPNMAVIEMKNLNQQFDIPQYANNWRFVGIDISPNAQTNNLNTTWAKGFTYRMISSTGGGRFGQRDLHLTTGASVAWLGTALELSADGNGAIISVSPATMDLTTGNVTFVGQGTHWCDNVTVTCASVSSDIPSQVTFGYGVTINSIAVSGVSCPAGYSGAPCQQLVANITIASDALQPYDYTHGIVPIAATAMRTPLIRTFRSASGHIDELTDAIRGFGIFNASMPSITSMVNVTQGSRPVIGMNTAAGVAQTIKIIGTNTHFLSNGALTNQNISQGYGNPTQTNIVVVSDTEIDETLTFSANSYREIHPLQPIVIPGVTGAPVPIVSYTPLMWIVPTGTEASFITNLSCPHVIAGGTYTCDVIGNGTPWIQGTTIADFDTITMPNGQPDVAVTATNVLSPTHAQITFTVDASAPAGADHITFDRCYLHGIFPTVAKNTAGIYEPVPPYGTAQLLGDVYLDEGRYMAILDSELGYADYLTYPSINESHILVNQAGPGPRYLRNNYLHDASILSFSAGGVVLYASPNMQLADFVYIGNNYQNSKQYIGFSYPQYLQPGQNAHPPTTHFVATLSGTTVASVADATPIGGFSTCPNYIYISGGGGSGLTLNCAVVGGFLQFTVANHGVNYTSPPNIQLEYDLFGIKNLQEHKNVRRALTWGNYFGPAWGNSLLNQTGNSILMSPKSGSQGNLFNTIEDWTVRSNWMDWQSVAISLYTQSDQCYSINSGAISSLNNPTDCNAPWDPRGTLGYPTGQTAGYLLAYPGADLSYTEISNNLITGRAKADLTPYGAGPTSAIIPGELINTQSNIFGNGTVFANYKHNTMWRYPTATVSANSMYWNSVGWSIIGYTQGVPPFSINWAFTTIDNVMWCQPNGINGWFGLKWVQAQAACPTTAGQSCPINAGDYKTDPAYVGDWQYHLYGNQIYNGPGCGTVNSVDWTYSGLISPAANGMSSVIPTFVNSAAYVQGVTPGDWTLVSPLPPATTDGLVPGVDMTQMPNFTNVVTGNAGGPTGPNILSTSLPTGAVGESYNGPLTANGGTTPYTWSDTSGFMPACPALSVNNLCFPATDTGGGTNITGTPSVAGTTSLVMKITDASSLSDTQPLTLTINTALTITTLTLPDGTVNRAYSTTINASGGLGAYTWSIASGAMTPCPTLTNGLCLNASGGLAGTPVGAGTSSFTVQVADPGGATAQQLLSLTIGLNVAITTSSLPDAILNTSYTATLAGIGGTPPYTWAIIAGTLPTGLSLAPGTGVISGTPTATGTANFTVRLTDSVSNTTTSPLSINVNSDLQETNTSLQVAAVGQLYLQNLTATGGFPPYSFQVTGGTLPAGLNIVGATISGTPVTPGTSNFSIQVTDSQSSIATSIPLSIVVLNQGRVTANGVILKNVIVKP